MYSLLVSKAKPNPAGKDSGYGDIPNSQLAGEWVDFTNDGSEGYPLGSIILQHIKYPDNTWEDVTGFTGTLEVGQVVRVHSGGEVPLSTLHRVDVIGADFHIFTGNGYIWNNDKSDAPHLILKQDGKIYEVDKASYDAYPVEGKILMRVGNKLV